MFEYSEVLDAFTKRSIDILQDNLVGIYLHGSAAMGCFNPKKSDIDLIIVVKEEIPNDIKRRYMDMVVELNNLAPVKGIEFSIVKGNVCKPFVYPTPFELHFSIAHLDWYNRNPEEYVEKMKGSDKDLAAHFTIIIHCGKTLYGKEIRDVFGEVSKDDYFDSIWNDIEDAQNQIVDKPMYIILNLCRVLAYKKDELILSKDEGGRWGCIHLPGRYHKLISDALQEYRTGDPMRLDVLHAKEYAIYMLNQIKKLRLPS
jgi:streptomycin 3"-adenylyltransferase